MRRPPIQVLGDEALVPERNRMGSPPDTFTHRVELAQAFYYDLPVGSRGPDGTLHADAQVKLLHEAADGYCWVVDEAGIRVATKRAGLVPLS